MSNKVSLTYTNSSGVAQNVATGTPLPTMAADAGNFNNSTLTNGTVVNGLFSSGIVVNPSTNQILIGPIDTTGAASWDFWLAITSGTGVVVIFQESADQTNWASLSGQASGNNIAGLSGNFPTVGGGYSGAVHQRYMRVVVSTGGTETLTVSGYLRGYPFVSTVLGQTPYLQSGITTLQQATGAGTLQQIQTTSKYLPVLPYSIPEVTWQYSTNGTPITTATTVVLQAAGAANVRNYLTGISLDNTGTGVATEIQILDGANVIYDGFIGAASATLNDPHYTVPFPVPLRGSAATSMSLKVVTTGAAIYASAQGYQAY